MLQKCTKQHRLWSRLYFPKFATKVSPIPHTLLQCDPATPCPWNWVGFSLWLEISKMKLNWCYEIFEGLGRVLLLILLKCLLSRLFSSGHSLSGPSWMPCHEKVRLVKGHVWVSWTLALAFESPLLKL